MPENPNQSLAIANIPIQPWGELLDDEKALCTGTVFQDLNLPFYAAEQVVSPSKHLPSDEREKLMTKISQVSFVLDDLNLYLDTHPEDAAARSLFLEKNGQRAQLKAEFAEKFYPLTRDCIKDDAPAGECFCWQKGPKPWEGACV